MKKKKKTNYRKLCEKCLAILIDTMAGYEELFEDFRQLAESYESLLDEADKALLPYEGEADKND